MMLIIIGFVLILLGILVAMPFIGLGTFLPFIGDMIDIPISGVMILIGLIFLIVGGLGYIISTYWWAIILGFAIWYVLFVLKIGVGKVRRKKR